MQFLLIWMLRKQLKKIAFKGNIADAIHYVIFGKESISIIREFNMHGKTVLYFC